MAAALSPLTAAASGRALQQPLNAHGYGIQILTTPSTGDELGFRTAIQHGAQARSDALFQALAKVLGGSPPTLNFQPTVAGGEFHAYADPAANQIVLDPAATLGIVSDQDTFHDGAINGLPHEMAHLRQTPQVLASIPVREGGAQAFADTTTNLAAAAAGIPYTPGFFDGSYAPYVQQAQQRGRDWILSGQFGRPPTVWP